jgi:hypothetical protein
LKGGSIGFGTPFADREVPLRIEVCAQPIQKRDLHKRGSVVHLAAILMGSVVSLQVAGGIKLMQEPLGAFGDIADDLHIIRRAISLAVPNPPSRFVVEGEFYKDGKKLPYGLKLDRRYGRNAGECRGFRVGLHLFDPDFLKLAAATPHSYQWQLSVSDNSGYETKTQVDVPKRDLDFRMSYFGLFPPQPGLRNRLPVCYMLLRSEESDKPWEPPQTFQEFLGNKQQSTGLIVFVSWN